MKALVTFILGYLLRLFVEQTALEREGLSPSWANVLTVEALSGWTVEAGDGYIFIVVPLLILNIHSLHLTASVSKQNLSYISIHVTNCPG